MEKQSAGKANAQPTLSPQDVQYRFYRLYSIDLDSAKYSLRLLRRYRRNDIRFLILREFVVAYSRPFSVNKSLDGKTHQLSLKFVPRKLRPLHSELVALRMQIFAHTDFTYHQPKVSMWETARGRIFPMSFRRPNYEGLLARIGQIERLVNAVEATLHAAIREHEAIA